MSADQTRAKTGNGFSRIAWRALAFALGALAGVPLAGAKVCVNVASALNRASEAARRKACNPPD